MASNLRRSEVERAALAERRLQSVLRTYTVCSMRTLENKISDGGPADQRIDPHLLTEARNRLLAAQIIRRTDIDCPWYYLASASDTAVQAKINELLTVHRRYQRLAVRMGQALEIAVYRALRQHRHNFVGHFSDLHAHDDRRLYTKVDPPRVISGQPMPGEKLLDFVGFHASGPFGIEVKNIREWIYPNRVEIIDLVQKATAIDAVPVLIARRIHFSTFLVMSRCGVIVHQNFNQVLPATAGTVATQGQAQDAARLSRHPARKRARRPAAALLR